MHRPYFRYLSAAALAALLSAVPALQASAQEALKIIGPWEIHSLDPANNGQMFTRLQVAEGLVDADTRGTLRPGLASHWKSSPNALSWHFTLRSGVSFHDGSPVTAAAVVNALEIARKKPGVLKTAPIKSIRAQDDAVVVELTKPFAPLPALFAHFSTQVLAPASYAADGSVTQVIGSGPYRISQLSQPQSVQVTAFERWKGTPPAIREAKYLAVGRAETRALMAESGQSDLTFGIDPVSLARLKKKAATNIASVTLPRTILFKVNAAHPLLKDTAVRQALSLSLDRKSIATALLRDAEMAATQLFPPSMGEWHKTDLAPLTFNPEKAKSILAAQGWKPGPDGLLSRDGQRFELTLTTFPDRPELPVLASAIQDQWRKIGIGLTVKIGNSSEIPAGHRDGSLQLGLAARNFALVPEPLVTLLEDYGDKGGDWGAMNWTSPLVTTALNRLALDPTANEGRAHRAQIVTQLQTELPIIPVAWYRQHAAVSKKLTGVSLDPLERSYLISEMRWKQ